MKERFILRNEPFGGTLFDRKTLRYKYLKREELRKDISMDGNKVQNPERWKANLDTAPSDILSAPIRVYFETTRVCNLRCRHCFNASGVKDSNEMNTEDIFRVLDGMRQDNVFDIRFTGGEFIMRPDWNMILERAKSLGFAVSINTNGVFREPSVIDKLAMLDLALVNFSIDGVREHHDYLRGKGVFDAAINNMRELHKRGVSLRTNTLLTKRTVADMEDIIQIIAPLVDEMNFFHMRATGRARTMMHEALSYQELYEFNDKARQIVKKYPNASILFAEEGIRQNTIKMNELGLRMGNPDGFTKFVICSDGSLWAGGFTPHIDRDLEYGNIKKEGYTLLNVWRNSPKLDNFRNFSTQLLMRCLSCPELDVRCSGTNVEMELIRVKFPHIGNPYCISDQPLPEYPIKD